MDFEGRARIRSHLDIAPLIDVVFLLLVFFMLTSTFITPEAVELELPRSASATTSEAPRLTVTLGPAGELTLDGEAIKLERLDAAIARAIEGQEELPTVTLRSDARTELQRLLEVMDRIRAGGATRIALATTKAP